MTVARPSFFQTALRAIMLAGVSAALFAISVTPAWAEDDDSVSSAQEALDRSFGGFPWYESADDDVRRIDVEPTRVRSGGWAPDWSFPTIPTMSLFVWIVIGMVVALLLYALLRSFLRRDFEESPQRVHQTPTITDIDRVEALPFAVRRPHADLLAEARRHYEQGEFGEAMVYLYSHFLVQLDRHHVIHLTKGKTNRQYVQETNARPPLRDILESSMVVFEDVFFGKHTISRTRFESCWFRVDQFNQHVQQGEP